MLPGQTAPIWRKSSRPAPDLVRRMPTSGFRTSSTKQRPIWTTPERQRPNCLCGSPPPCFSAPLLPVWRPREAETSGILTPVLPTERRDRNRGGNHGPWNSALPVGSPHSDHHSSRPLAALDRRRVLQDIVRRALLAPGLPCRDEARFIAPRSRSEQLSQNRIGLRPLCFN